jgi:hypothetical protein
MSYKRQPLGFKEKLSTRRDTLVLSELELLHACILILEPHQVEKVLRFEGEIEREGL